MVFRKKDRLREIFDSSRKPGGSKKKKKKLNQEGQWERTYCVEKAKKKCYKDIKTPTGIFHAKFRHKTIPQYPYTYNMNKPKDIWNWLALLVSFLVSTQDIWDEFVRYPQQLPLFFLINMGRLGEMCRCIRNDYWQ